MSPAVESCATCRFSEPSTEFGRGILHCRRYPPSGRGAPLVTREQWCGEHSPLVASTGADLEDDRADR